MKVLSKMGLNSFIFCALMMLILGSFAGCKKSAKKSQLPAMMKAKYTGIPIKINGILDDHAWKKATVYKMSLGKDKKMKGEKLKEGGEVMLSWDSNYFYVGIKFYDSDIVAEGEEDQLHHYKMGDVVEVFLKPEGYTWYWELYATPRNKKTSFWFPGRGRLWLDSASQYNCGLKVAAKCEGTLNRWEDKDNNWTAEMAMPIDDLTVRGEKFAPDSKWRILVARYNYSRYLPWKELSMAPQLSRTSYHLYEEYAVLKLGKIP